MTELILIIVQVIAAMGVVISVVYLGMQINQQNKLQKHNLVTHLHSDSMTVFLIQQKILSFQSSLLKTGLLMI